MKWEKTLFDAVAKDDTDRSGEDSPNLMREVSPLDRLKNLEGKITAAVERVKALKEEKTLLERKVRDLERLLNEQSEEIEALRSEKSSIGNQISELLSELEAIES
jgi:septal ring factor EnvC (AmiA/AmiB activator)